MNKYTSPFSDRYEDEKLSKIWSEKTTRLLWRRAWWLLLKQQRPMLQARMTAVERANISLLLNPMSAQYRSFFSYGGADHDVIELLEKKTNHELVANLDFIKRTWPILGKWMHIGTTSSNIQDYATFEQIKLSKKRIERLQAKMTGELQKLTMCHKDTLIMGRTHLQRAEPTTIGYRLAWFLEQIDRYAVFHASPDLLYQYNWEGAVGTNANQELIGNFSNSKPIDTVNIRFQTYPRQHDLFFFQAYAHLASILHKLSLDMRLMYMNDAIGGHVPTAQVGSSAMPGKRNPIKWEKITGLSRRVPLMAQEMWTISANTMLERTLDDSAPCRSLLPEMFLLMAEIIKTTTEALKQFHVDKAQLECEVMLCWKDWLPSRLQTYRQMHGLPVDRQEIENCVRQSTGWSTFLRKMVPNLVISDLKLFLFLGEHVKKTVERYE